MKPNLPTDKDKHFLVDEGKRKDVSSSKWVIIEISANELYRGIPRGFERDTIISNSQWQTLSRDMHILGS